jgi:hypothetical protein
MKLKVFAQNKKTKRLVVAYRMVYDHGACLRRE